MNYVHHLSGRLRVRVAGVKRNPTRAHGLQAWLTPLEGVERATVSELTGSVLIHYRPDMTDADRLLAAMREHGWNIESPAASRPPASALEHALTRLIVQSVAQVVLERSLVALSAAIL
jgi:hypothetical protein